MKFIKRTSRVVIIGFATLFSCGSNKELGDEDKAKNFLLDYYNSHLQILVLPSNLYERRNKSLDSLLEMYCTDELIVEAKEASENSGADVLTCDLGSVVLNENLKVEKETTKENFYKVSFWATYKDIPGGPTKEQVFLFVKVDKQSETYKIKSVDCKKS